MAPRVGVVAVFHETNTFSPRPTGREEFAARWLVGERLREEFAGTRTVVGGFLDGAHAHRLAAVPVFGTYATPAGPVTAEAMAAITGQLTDALRRCAPLDGVLLELHGAMVAEGVDDPEQRLVAVLREMVGAVPVACVLDLHANLGRDRLREVDVLLGYRTNPHVDTWERGRDAAAHLSRVLAGRLRPVRVHRPVPVIAAPVAQRTDAEPLVSVLGHARKLEAAEGLVDVTVHAGYAYADVPQLGMGVSITAEAERAPAAARAADELAGLAWQGRERFRRDLPGPAEAFADAAAGGGERAGPVAVADTGDNINGGAPGDATWLLAEAVARDDVPTLASVWDPAAVATAARAGAGAVLRVPLGGRSGPGGGAPLPVDAQVISVVTGTFVNRGPMATGVTVSMGTAAVLRIGRRCDVVVQQRAVQPNDPELFRCAGLDPADYRVVLLKGAAALRAGWGGVASRFVDAGTGGVTDSRLERLAFTRAPAGLWPLPPVGRSGAVHGDQ